MRSAYILRIHFNSCVIFVIYGFMQYTEIQTKDDVQDIKSMRREKNTTKMFLMDMFIYFSLGYYILHSCTAEVHIYKQAEMDWKQVYGTFSACCLREKLRFRLFCV